MNRGKSMPFVPRPLPFVLAATDLGPMIVNHLDRKSADGGGTFGVGYQLLNSGAYDPDEVCQLQTMLSGLRADRGDGVFAIDCGANIGVHTLAWARHMAGWGEVLAIEAQERIFYALAGNIALNNHFNARAIWAAAGRESGTLPVPQPDYREPGSFGSLELVPSAHNEHIGQEIDYSEAALRPVRAMCLDELGFERVDMIKIDVEGMELAVLDGAVETIRRCRPYLFVEHMKTGEAPLVAFLEAVGYRHWAVTQLNMLAMPADDPGVDRVVVG